MHIAASHLCAKISAVQFNPPEAMTRKELSRHNLSRQIFLIEYYTAKYLFFQVLKCKKLKTFEQIYILSVEFMVNICYNII